MTIEVSRRQLMASMGGMVLGSFALPSALRKALDNAPASVLSHRSTVRPISEIEHVVVLMQENRSFDHYFGAMPGVRGFSDPTAIPGVFKQPDSDNPDGYLYPFHADTHSTSAQNLPSTNHDWAPQHDSWNNGAMNGFVSSRINTTIDSYDGSAGQYSMAYFKRDDIPFQWALADAFTICDGYHSSVMGPTWPNRLYLMTGQIDPTGANGGPIYGNSVPDDGYSWQTYPEMLSAAGVSWKVYQEVDNYGFNVLEYFDQYQNASTSSPLYQNAMKFYQPGQFEYDAINDRLPTVSYILPTSYQSEHPDFMPAAGADYVASKVNAIAANPDVWAKTVFILIYDENDGYFDHVLPPTAPAGTPGEYITASAKAESGRAGPHRPRFPRPLHHRLAVDGGRLRLPRHVRPHLGDPAPRAGDRRGQSQHHRLAAARPSATSPPRSAPPRSGGSRGCRTPRRSSSWPRRKYSSSSSRPSRVRARPCPSSRPGPSRCAAGSPRPPLRPPGA